MSGNIGKRTLRILFLSQEYPPETGWGGIGTYVKIMAKALAGRGHEVHVLSAVEGQNEHHYLDEDVHVHRVKQIHIKGLGRLARMMRMQETAARLLNALSNYSAYLNLKVDFDVVEYPNWHAEGLIFSLIRSRALVTHLHTPLFLVAQCTQRTRSIDTRLAEFLEKVATKRADIITSASESAIQKVATCYGIERERVFIVPHPMDVLSLPRQEAGSVPPRVLFVGRLEERKNPEIIVRTVPHILRSVPKAEFVFGGTGNKDSLQQLASQLRVSHAVKFEGHLEDEEVWNWRLDSRVCVVPSLYESFGLVVTEAMAVGRPVVGSNRGGIPEIIQDGKTGILVDPEDVEGWVNALIKLLGDPDLATRMGERAREEIRTRFAPDVLAEKREMAYRKAIRVHYQRKVMEMGPFLNAIPSNPNGMEIPAKWRECILNSMLKHPWYHVYFYAARQLLGLVDGPVEGKQVLDLGCTPHISVLLALLGAEVTMLDNSEVELKKAEKLADELGVQGRIHLLKADLFGASFDRQFDIVWNFGTIEHFDPLDVVKIMALAARPGGQIIPIVPNVWTPHTFIIRPWQRWRGKFYWDYMGREKSYTPWQLSRIMKKAGLKVLKTNARNLRRTVLDDCLIEKLRLGRPTTRGLLFKAMNGADWLERVFPPLRFFGFFTGAVGIKPGA